MNEHSRAKKRSIYVLKFHTQFNQKSTNKQDLNSQGCYTLKLGLWISDTAMGVHWLFSRGGQNFPGGAKIYYLHKKSRKDTIFLKKSRKTNNFGRLGGQGPPLALPCGRIRKPHIKRPQDMRTNCNWLLFQNFRFCHRWASGNGIDRRPEWHRRNPLLLRDDGLSQSDTLFPCHDLGTSLQAFEAEIQVKKTLNCVTS